MERIPTDFDQTSIPPANSEAADSAEAEEVWMDHPEQTWTIGKSPDCDVIIEGGVVSRKHCRLVKTARGFFVEDLGSTNGTYGNDIRVTSPVRVSLRDRVTLGKRTPMPWPDDARDQML